MSKLIERSRFSVGDKVTWSSQAGGCIQEKTGEVIEVVPPKKTPNTKIKGSKDSNPLRNHESYIVHASYTDSNNKTRTANYWPIVSKLTTANKTNATLNIKTDPEKIDKEKAEKVEIKKIETKKVEVEKIKIPEKVDVPAELPREEEPLIKYVTEKNYLRSEPIPLDEIEPLFTKEELKGKRE